MDPANATSISLATAEATVVYHYCILASAVILFYDFIITLEAEVHHVWKRKFTTVTALFLLNRYLNLVLSAASLLAYVPMSGVHCEILCVFSDVLQILADLNTSVFGALRVWAIWERKWVIFVIILSASIVAPLLNIYRISTTRFPDLIPDLPDAGCAWASYLSSAARSRCASIIPCSARDDLADDLNRVTTIIQIAGILTNSLIFFATLLKMVKIQREAWMVGLHPAITTLIIQQGLLWWLLLLVVGIIPLVVDQLKMVVNPANFFNSVMHSIMLSRFILALRDLNDPHGSYRKQKPPMDSLDEIGGLLKSYDEEDGLQFNQLNSDYVDVETSPTVTSVRFAYPSSDTGLVTLSRQSLSLGSNC